MPDGPTSTPPTDRLVWIDLEMTGLSTARDEIVEIACIVTEADLTEVDEGISLVIQPSPEAWAGMDPFVVNMHEMSGLSAEVNDGITLEQATAQVMDYITTHIPEARKAPLAGSSVYVDRMFLARYMPSIDEYLHYRIIDVSSINGSSPCAR